MKPKAKLSWWVIPSVVTGSIAMLGGMGTCAVKYAAYESLPQKVEAAQQKNEEQDKALNGLGTIAEQNQKLLDKWDKIYEQAKQHAPNQVTPMVRPPKPEGGLREWDDAVQTFWCCPLHDRQRCFDEELWWRCE